MERHIERRIVLERRDPHQVGRIIKTTKVDAKVRELIVEPKCEHPVRAGTDRLGAQQGIRSSGIGFHGEYLNRLQYFSSERPTESVKSCGFDCSGV